ncbi:zinc finger CCCH domain-containing protein 3 isoform X1 [Equus asinus]|uniref:zinc finger CCCH domain-containing protein 3 isoform X1 n=1 Tax=Equus asinus TaxID=9793 RepID=UPI001D05BA6D|nr:zinc finger CCCH domain-containing protein 3 isoform X1 [Equus asinus]
MTSRGPGRASRTVEMEEKEQLRRQIRLLQGLIDDYKNLHGSAPVPGTSAASRWQPPAYNSSRAFSARYPCPSRRGFSPNHGPAWRKKYSLVNRPPGSLDLSGDCASRPPLGARSSQRSDPQQYVLERQVQLSPDQNMVIKIKPPSKPSSASAAGVPRGSWEEREDSPRSHHRPQEGEGEPPGGQQQPLRPGRAKGSCSAEDSLLVCQKEPGKPRVVKSVSNVSDSPSEPQRTVSESTVLVKAHSMSSTLLQRGGMALGRKVGSQSVASCVAQLLGDGGANANHPDQPAPSGLVADPARPASGPRQTPEASLLVSCRTNKFRKNNYKWVAASAKSPRATRRALSPRSASENVSKTPLGTAERVDKPQLRANLDAKPRRSAMSSTPGASPSKYKWKASSPSAASSSSFRWQSEAGSKDHASQLSPVPSRSPPGDRPAVGPSDLKPLFSETPISAYKVKSRTKIIRRRGSASLPGDKKSSPPPAATAKSQFSMRRRQAFRGKSSPVLKKTPNKGLMQVTRHRLCSTPLSRAHLSTKEASSVHTLRTPPTSKVIKTRYRIVKKTSVSPLNAPQAPLSLPFWRARRLSLSRSLVLNRLRPTAAGGKAQPTSPRWRNKGYRCIGGVLYKVSANKLSKTYGRPSGDGGSRPLLRTGRLDPASSCSRSLASRAVQRSLAIVRQARQKKRRKKEEYCMYYNRFGRCKRGEGCPYIHDPEKVAVCTRCPQPFWASQVCSGHMQEDRRDLSLLPPRLQGEDARVLLLPEGDLQQQQLSLQPRLRVPEGRGLRRLPQRLLPAGCKVQEEAHTAVPRLLPQGCLPPGGPVPAAPPRPEAPQPADCYTHGPRAQQHSPQEQGVQRPRAQEVLGHPAPHQTDAQLPHLHGCWLSLPSLLPPGVSCSLSLSLVIKGPLLLLFLPFFPLLLSPLPLVPLPVLGPRGAVSPGRGCLCGDSDRLRQPLQAAFLHLPAVLAKPRRPAQGPDFQEPPNQGLRETSAHQTPSVRAQGASSRLPQPLVPGEEGGSAHHHPRGGTARHQAPTGGHRATTLPAWLSAFHDQSVPRALPSSSGWAPAQSDPPHHPPPHLWVLSLAPRTHPQPSAPGPSLL